MTGAGVKTLKIKSISLRKDKYTDGSLVGFKLGRSVEGRIVGAMLVKLLVPISSKLVVLKLVLFCECKISLVIFMELEPSEYIMF